MRSFFQVLFYFSYTTTNSIIFTITTEIILWKFFLILYSCTGPMVPCLTIMASKPLFFLPPWREGTISLVTGCTFGIGVLIRIWEFRPETLRLINGSFITTLPRRFSRGDLSGHLPPPSLMCFKNTTFSFQVAKLISS